MDPLSVDRLMPENVGGFVQLARELHAVFVDTDGADEDSAAGRLNGLLAANPAHPHLAKEGGRWRLHHHLSTVALVEMWKAAAQV